MASEGVIGKCALAVQPVQLQQDLSHKTAPCSRTLTCRRRPCEAFRLPSIGR